MRYFLGLVLLIILLVCNSSKSFGQKTITLQGIIYDEDNEPIQYVQVLDKTNSKSYFTDESGKFVLKARTHNTITLEIRFLGFKTTEINIYREISGKYEFTIHMKKDIHLLSPLNIKDRLFRNGSFYILNPTLSTLVPNASGSFEAYLKTIPGVFSNSELGSDYSVRGGNYDENLIYINDVEIFKPFLVEQGQQEGLSFINPEMVSKIKFSTGGFGAEYGDKMSSALDITYKKPSKTEAGLMISFLGGSLNVESSNKAGNFGLLVGLRERSNQFLLNSLDVQGNYRPLFSDLQTLIRWQIHPKLTISSILYAGYNRYKITPTERKTTFGTSSQAYELNVNFQGEEVDHYRGFLGAIILDYDLSARTSLKWIGSIYQSSESQQKDIQGDYLFNESNLSPLGGSSPTSGMVKGIGIYGEGAGNSVKFLNTNLESKGITRIDKQTLNWGIKFSHASFQKKIDQITYLDTLPYNYASIPSFSTQIYTRDSFNHFSGLEINKYSLFLVDALELGTRFHLEGGFRGSYIGYNREFLISPRFNFSYKPAIDKDLILKGSYGIYYQVPILNEYFNYDGTIIPSRPSQKSIFYSISSALKFKGLGRILDFNTSIYYKDLSQLIPYEIYDVRIDYLGDKTANGYAYGLDLLLKGQFSHSLESSISVSVQKTEENIENYFFKNSQALGNSVPVGFLPRPTDQRMNIALFFQDKLAGDPSTKVHLSLIYGSNLPIGPPDHEPYKDIFRVPAYRRVDIGFSREFIHVSLENKKPFPFLRSLTANAEIFNLLDINNTISYFWIRDISGNQFAVPNYLTSRVLNLKVVAKF